MKKVYLTIFILLALAAVVYIVWQKAGKPKTPSVPGALIQSQSIVSGASGGE